MIVLDTAARIEELEFPRDDSLDNAIVLWLSACFVNTKSDNLTGGPMGPLLGKLEDSGLKVWTCSDSEEAIDRARQLLISGRLRCIVTGGGESDACQPGCTREHPGQVTFSGCCCDIFDQVCLSCGLLYEMHRNHDRDAPCPNAQHFGNAQRCSPFNLYFFLSLWCLFLVDVRT